MLIEIDADGVVQSTEAGDWYPDDTVLLQETPQGRETPHGPIRVSRWQASDWPGRAARQWDEREMRWVLTGADPSKTEIEQAREALQSALPPSASLRDVIDYLNKSRLVVVDIDEEKRRRLAMARMARMARIDRRPA